MITKCGGMESGRLRSLRPSLRGTDVCTHMHESPTAEHANGGEPVMVLIQKLACSSALLLHPSPSAATLLTPPLIHPSPSAVTLFTPPLIQSSIHPCTQLHPRSFCASASAMHGHRPPSPTTWPVQCTDSHHLMLALISAVLSSYSPTPKLHCKHYVENNFL